MTKKNILFRFSLRFFIGNFIFSFFLFSSASYFLDNYTPLDLGNVYDFTLKLSLFLTIVMAFFFNNRLNQKENTKKKAFSNYTIPLNKSKEEFTQLIKQFIPNAYFQEEEDYLKIYTYNYYSLKNLIFITFKENEIFITTKPVFSDLSNYDVPKNIKLIEVLAK